MYSLSDFEEFDYLKEKITGSTKVLVWNRKLGYYFTEFGFIFDLENNKIIAKEII